MGNIPLFQQNAQREGQAGEVDALLLQSIEAVNSVLALADT